MFFPESRVNQSPCINRTTTALKRWRFEPQDNVHHRLRIEFTLGTDEP